MPSAVLFSNASFDEPAQATVLRSIESVKRKVFEDDTFRLYESCCSNNLDEKLKKEVSIKSESILGSVDNYVEHETINTILEGQISKINVISDLKPPTKKRKLKIIPNKVDVVIKEDAKNKTITLMTKVIIHFYIYICYFNIYIINSYLYKF